MNKSRIIRIIGGGLGLLLLLAIIGLATYPYWPAPKIDGYLKKGEVKEISYNAPLKVDFSQWMSNQSVEDNFTVDKYVAKSGLDQFVISKNENQVKLNLKYLEKALNDQENVDELFDVEKDIEGKLKWDGRSLIFEPKSTPDQDEIYRIRLKKEARALTRKRLHSNYEAYFRFVEKPQVLYATPDDVTVPTNAKITVQFSRPMVKLGLLDNTSEAEQFIQISPKVAGDYKWIGTSGIQFVPERLAYGTDYEVKIPAGIKSVDGGIFEDEYSFKFSTKEPLLETTKPYPFAENLGPETKMKLDFNQPIDLVDLKNKMYLFQAEENIGGLWNVARQSKTITLSEEIKQSQNKISVAQTLFGEDSDKLVMSKENIQKLGWKETAFNLRYLSEAEYKTDFSIEGDLDEEERNLLTHTVVIETNGSMPLNRFFMVGIEDEVKGSEGNKTLKPGRLLSFKTAGKPIVTGFDGVGSEGEESYNTKSIYVYFSNPMEKESLFQRLSFEPKPTIDEKSKDKAKDPFGLNPRLNSDGDTLVLMPNLTPNTTYRLKIAKGAKDKFGQTIADDYEYEIKTKDLPESYVLTSKHGVNVLNGYKKPQFFVDTTNIDKLDFHLQKLDVQGLEEHNQDEILDLVTLWGVGELDKSEAPVTSKPTPTATTESDSQEGDIANIELPEPLLKLEPTPEIIEPTPPKKRTITDGLFWRTDYKKVENKKITHTIDLNKSSGQKLKPGLYSLFLVNPDDTRDKRYSSEYKKFLLTRTALTYKYTDQKVLVWATDLRTGQPVAGMNIEVMKLDEEKGYQKQASKKTDENGLAQLELPANEEDNFNNYFLITGKKGDDFTLVQPGWSDGINPWDFNIEDSYRTEDYYTHIYTDRPIYRPGHVVHYKGIVRKNQDIRFELPKQQEVEISVLDSQGKEIINKMLPLGKHGTFNDSITLNTNVPTGTFNIDVTLPGEDQEVFSGSFKVAEYRTPDYKVELNTDREDYSDGDVAKVKVDVDYYFGSPLADADVRWTVQRMDYFFNEFTGDGWFSFSDSGYFCYWGCEPDTKIVTSGKGKLNAQGELEIELPLDLGDSKQSQIYSIEVTAEDVTNQTVSNRISIPVHKGEYYVGINNRDYVTKLGEKAVFDVVTVDYDGKPMAKRQVKVTNNVREWKTVRKKNVDGDYYYSSNFKDRQLEQKTVTTDDQGRAEVSFDAKEGGSFRIIAEATDNQGRIVSAATSTYVSSSAYTFWGRDNNDRIELVTDKQEYAVGDTAKILVKSPYANVKALLTLERDSVIEHKIIELKSNSQTIEIPIEEGFVPNMFVSVVLAKGDQQDVGIDKANEELSADREIEAFKMGYTTLFVDTASKALDVKVETDKTQYTPREKVNINLETLDYQGQPQAAEVSIAVVDESVLALAGNKEVDLLNYFYRKRMLNVDTAHTLTKAISRINVAAAQGAKGGGGGASSGLNVRSKFKDSAFWVADIETDEKGKAKVEFELPDNLTNWRVLAVAVTDETLVGSEKANFSVTKDVLVQPILPRFMTAEDEMEIGVVVHNRTDREISTGLKLHLSGLELNGGSESQNLAVAANDKVKIMWPIKVKNENLAVIRMETDFDTIEKTLQIKPASVAEISASSGILKGDAQRQERVWLPDLVDMRFGELEVTAAPTLSGSLADGSKYLLKYPYGCAEQTASSLLPNLVLKQLKDLPSISNDLVDDKKLDKNAKSGIQRLYKFQNYDGGWGLWEGSDSRPYLTAYILATLKEAQDAGYQVDDEVIKEGVRYLNNALFNGDNFERYGFGNNRAYALYVLTDLNKGDLGLANNLYLKRDQLGIYGKALLAMTFDLMLAKDDQKAKAVKSDVEEKIRVLKEEILAVQVATPREVHFEEDQYDYWSFDSNSRSTAYVLQLFAKTDPEHPVTDKIVNYLIKQKRGGYWRNTQETAVVTLSLVEYLLSNGELNPAFTAKIKVNEQQKAKKIFSAENLTEKEVVTEKVKDLLLNNEDNKILIQQEGKGRLYYDLVLRYFLPLDQAQVRDEGIAISHEYYDLNDQKEAKPLQEIAIGQTVKGKLTVVVPEDRRYVVVEDLLPAGLEGVDFQLETAEQNLEQSESLEDWRYWNPLWRFNHSEIRDDRMVYFADDLPAGTYEITYFARATSKGKFRDLPAQAMEMYTPEVFGRSRGRILEIK